MKFYVAYSLSKGYIQFYYNIVGDVCMWETNQNIKENNLFENKVKLEKGIRQIKDHYSGYDFPKDVVIQEYSLVKTK